MNVLALSRQLGCQGDLIARRIAKQLAWKYLDHDLINRAAREAGVPELALAHIDELGLLGLTPTPQEQRAYLNQVEAIIREQADEGKVVVVGCAGQVILANHPQTLRVQVVAPFETRLAALMQTENITEPAAMERLLTSDKRRAAYLKQHYGINWLDPALYDIIVNTTKITPEAAVPCIVRLLKHV